VTSLYIARASLLALAISILIPPVGQAQGRNTTPRENAPIDLTGYWVSVVSEDWRFRMVVAQKGDWDIIPLNAEGQRVAASADLARDAATDDQCKAYGAAGIMRIPGRLHITWEDDSTLRVDTDSGMQTRRFEFDTPESGAEESTLQGHSVADWSMVNPRADVGGGASPGGELRVVTTHMLPGYYFKHGVPYSGSAVLREHFARVSEANGNEYLFVTSIVEDPRYLREEFVRTLVFKQEPDDSKWNPRPCSSL
jgi:hypothetical protein